MRYAALALFLVLLSASGAAGEPVTPAQARAAVESWLAADPCPLGAALGGRVRRVDTVSGADGWPDYHIVYLIPNGRVIVAGDDTVEPIVAFSAANDLDISPGNPMTALLRGDLPARVSEARRLEREDRRARGKKGARPDRFAPERAKWNRLIGAETSANGTESGLSLVSDPRIDSIIMSRWGQTTICGNAAYNYYAPPGPAGSASNYPGGCVATAMAQVMRLYRRPSGAVGPGKCFEITVCGVPETRCLLGGDGSGGVYNWASMIRIPDCAITPAQREAIGTLLHDCGVSVSMDYCSESRAETLLIADRLKDTFAYTGAIKGYSNGYNIPADSLNQMINSNLDAGIPVILGISGAPGGHAAVCDGYGYNSGTLYHHLNMGWAGSEDEYYNLPTIDSSPGPFDTVRKCVYNIYVTGSGEIISGRVLTAAGVPLASASISAVRSGGGTYTTTSNARGIYALSKIPSDSEYTISVTKAGYTFVPVVVSTGASTDYSDATGNRWNVNLVANGNAPAAADVAAATVEAVPVTVTLSATDDGVPNPPGRLSYIITAMPEHGALTDPLTGPISTVPHQLAEYGDSAVYMPATGFSGQDAFTYFASDGGTPPEGGDSATANVRIRVADSCGQPLAPITPAPGEEALDIPTDTQLSWFSRGVMGVLENIGSTCDDFALARINSTAGLTGHMLSWASVGGATGSNLRSSYDVIHFTTNPSTADYANLRSAIGIGSALEEFTALGGVLLLNVSGNYGTQNDVGPGGLDYSRIVMHDAEFFTTPTHPYLTGLGFGGVALTTSMFSNWTKTDHGNLLQYPPNSTIVLSNSDGASMIEYPWGAGRVIATTVTLGWDGGGVDHAGPPWTNELLYAGSGIGLCPTKYDVYLGTSPESMALIAEGLTEPACNPGPLEERTRYYWKVVARRTQLQTESEIWSFVTNYDYSKSIGQAKLQADNRELSCRAAAVVYASGDTFYIEDIERSSGILVHSPGHGLGVDSLVKVAGTMHTNGDAERYIEAEHIIPAGAGSVSVMGLASSMVGGGDWHYNPITGAGQRGATLSAGPSTIGLLVKTWGRVVSVDSGGNSYVITDGSRYTIPDSGWPPLTLPIRVTVILPEGQPLPDVGSFQIVTGVCSCKLSGEMVEPVLLWVE